MALLRLDYGTWIFLRILLHFVFIKSCFSSYADDNFKEELLITPLANGFVNTHFEFTTEWNSTLPLESLHYNLFPRPLGQVIRKHNVQEMHLSLTQGLWRHDKWGFPQRGAPPGTQLWVWFHEETKDVDQAWAELVNALSGLFCASLNFIDETNTVQPQLSFRPQGVASGFYAKKTHLLRYATLPREIVCTENLTPWKKLLPCDSKAGLASLFKADKLYNTHYHSLSVHLRPVCRLGSACQESAVELSQALTVVFRPQAHRGQTTHQEWSLRVLFGKVLDGPCPMASTSRVVVDISRNESGNPITMSPPPLEVLQRSAGDEDRVYAIYDVKQLAGTKTNIAMAWSQPLRYGSVAPPPLLAYRYLSGYGQEKGGISCLLRNQLTTPLKVIYTETIPWYMRLYLHTLKIRNAGVDIKPDKVVFVPGKDRSRPYLLELVLTLPATSDTTLMISFDKAFLRWTEYPPDANIGFFINSAIVSVILPNAANVSGAGLIDADSEGSRQPGFFLRLYTEPLLIQLPTPDFSMPYNVICLACTVVAIAFGSLHNLSTRKFDFVEAAAAAGKKNFLKELLSKFRRGKKDGRDDGGGSGDGKEEEEEEEESREGDDEMEETGIRRESGDGDTDR
ncbi:GPI transamidase component PIG-T-like [Diadema setosum]|uniref:GPI transamidase component PIG-T-like n=1 Tax=Diadema setosum TaxID=31175 RepID=UPI003B3AD255